jgi:hypothetical protein
MLTVKAQQVVRDCSEIIPVVSFATLSYMLPPPFLGGGYLRKEINEMYVFVPDSVHTLYF